MSSEGKTSNKLSILRRHRVRGAQSSWSEEQGGGPEESGDPAAGSHMAEPALFGEKTSPTQVILQVSQDALFFLLPVFQEESD